MKGKTMSLPVSDTRKHSDGASVTIPFFIGSVLLAALLLYPAGASAYDQPWDGGHVTTSPGGGPGGGPPGGGGQGGGGDPVNLKAGNFNWTERDFLIPGLGGPLFISRYYNSQDRYVGPFGYGWHFMPFRRCIEVVSGETVEVVVKRGDGIRKIFIDNGDGTYRAKDGDSRHSLTKDPGGYHLTDYDGFTYHFDTEGNLLTVRDLNGNTLTYNYDPQGRISALSDMAGRQLTMTYDANNRIVSVDDFSGRSVSYGYDENNNLVSFTNALGQATLYTYDDDHLLLGVTDPAGTALIGNTYDSSKRVVSQLYAGANLSFTYNATYTRVNNRRDLNFDVYLNDLGNPVEVRDPSGSNYQMAFTAEGKPASLSDAQGQTRIIYDNSGRVRSFIAPDGTPTIYSYLGDTNLVASTTDALGRVTAYEYDGQQNLTRKTDPSSEQTQYEYDTHGKLKRIVYPNGAIADLEYSTTGYLTQLADTIGTDSYAASFAYDAVGNLTSVILADSSSVTFEYNALDQLTRVTDNRFLPVRITEYEYDPGGNIKKVRQNGQEKRLAYSNNLVSSITYPDATQTLYRFNGNDRISEVSYSQGSIVYAHDNVERVTAATHPDSSQFDFTWVNDNMVQVTGPGTDLALSYDLKHRLTEITDNANSKSLYFNYTLSNHRSRLTRTGGYSRNYTYDPAGRLTGYQDSDATSETFADPIAAENPATLNDIATAANYNMNNWLIRLLEAKGPGGAVSRNGVRYPDARFWTNTFSANKRWHLSLMPGLQSNRLNTNVRTPLDIMR